MVETINAENSVLYLRLSSAPLLLLPPTLIHTFPVKVLYKKKWVFETLNLLNFINFKDSVITRV